ncbi:MAG: hypothetical protein H6735_00530 [Alphaproteobacteria bacterium]|nr:hypothetical protein [Alphaproteobacteria bacterium]
MTTADPSRADPLAAVPMVGAVIAGIALIAFLAGTARSDYDFAPPVSDRAPVLHEVPKALSYAELRNAPRGADSAGFDAELASMRGPSPTDPVPDAGPASLAVTDRTRLRSFDGAPPRIPHPVRQDSAAECLTCHDVGLRFRGRLATPMSHRELASCTQCHVVDAAPMPGLAQLEPDPRDVPNAFVGLASPVAGPRAWSIAPPQVPHRTAMRERCDSCHGVNGRAAMRTPHPDRQSCEQCHAASAQVDLRPGVAR